jgi:preprotein translocase subunit YajC
MLISPAYAQGFMNDPTITGILPFILIFVVMYFLLIRPQQKKAQELKKMLGALRRGDRVVTGGGIIGTIAKVENDDEVLVDIAENTRVRVLRSTVTAVLAKTGSAAKDGGKDKGDDSGADGEGGDGKEKRKTAARSGAGK